MAGSGGKASILKIIKIEKAPVATEVKSPAEQSKHSTIKSKNNHCKEAVVSIVKKLSPLPIEEKLMDLNAETSAKKSNVAARGKNSKEEITTPIEAKQLTSEEKGKKILLQVPVRTPTELQATVDDCESEISQSQRIPAFTGTVSANLSEEGRPRLYPRQVRRVSASIIQKLLANPLIATPTWTVLVDNTISISTKIQQLQAIGWEPEIMPVKGFREICLLARMLGNGVD
jgi:hypothetical protein